MKLKRSVLAAAATLALSMGMVTGVATSASAATTTYEITPHNGDIYQVTDNVAKKLSYEMWENRGFPKPTKAKVKYVKYSWSNSIYAVTPWSNGGWDHITGSEWRKAGRPAPQKTNWVPGSYLFKWSTDPDIGIIEPSGKYHWLTASQWNAMGNPAPEHRAREGFAKLTWSNTIARMSDVKSGQGYPISYGHWASENHPDPLDVKRFAGDQFYQFAGTSTIFYAGPTMNRAITYREWVAAGAPKPTIKAAPDNRTLGKSVMLAYGFGENQWSCLEQLWTKESGWNHKAGNGSGAYGIPQALPGSKMASAGADWATNPETQIRWGLGYIKSMYGDPCGAWGTFQSKGWY